MEKKVCGSINKDGLWTCNHCSEQNKAIELAVRYGGIDGDHHKAWVIDQMVRILAGDSYEDIIKEAKSGEDGAETYNWNIGIAP